nr:Uma2 family endonuclease [Streptomyces coelicoflavus]
MTLAGLTPHRLVQALDRFNAAHPWDHNAHHHRWILRQLPLMVVEVTSYDSDTDRRDRVDKPRAYAGTDIPVYLLIDRDTCEVKVHSRPDGGRYETVQTLPFGKEVALPEPVGIVLDTEPLKNRVR